MDDIKSMEVGEEEEGGWAGHHEEVDYSKEVVFSDSSDEEGSPKKSHANKGKPVTPSTSQNDQGLEPKATDTRSSARTPECGKELLSNVRPRSPDLSHVPTEKGPEEGRDWRRKPKERNERRSDGGIGGGEMSNRHNVPYHPYSQQQHPGSVMYPQHSQYPPNYIRGGGYGVYQPPPPPQYGPGPSGGHHYPQPQMGGGGGGGRYQGGGGGHGRSNLKKNYNERDDYHGRMHDKDGRGSKRRWEEGREPPRPPVLVKEQDRSVSPLKDVVSSDKSEVNADPPPVPSEAPTIQQQSSPSDIQEGGSKCHVTFAERVEEVEGDDELFPQPTRRGSQPKLMLRKFGEKEVDLGADGKYNGKERSGDAKGSRPSDLQGLNQDDPSGADSNKARMAWNMNERGPIISPKTLYEPEGKKSADKFKKYHAHTQEPGRVGGTESQKYHTNNQENGRAAGAESQGIAEEATEKLKSPTEKERRDKDKHMELKKKQQQGPAEQGNGVRRPELGRRGSEEEKQLHGEGKRLVEKEIKKSVELDKEALSHTQVILERTPVSADNRRSSSRDKPHHRKEDSRRPRGGGGGGEKRSDFPARTDNRQTDTVARRAKDGGKRESIEFNRTGSSQQQSQQERRLSDQKGREDRGKRREPLRNKREGGGGGTHTDKKQTRRDDGRSSAEHPNRGGNNWVASEGAHSSEGKPEHRRHENERGKGQTGGRGNWPPRRGGIQQDGSRRTEHSVSEKHGHKDEFSHASTQRKFESHDMQKDGGKGEKDKIHVVQTHLALGYTDLEDILSSSDNEDSGRMRKPTSVGVAHDRGGRATCGRGGQSVPRGQRRTEEKGKQQRGEGRGNSERRPRGDLAREQQQQFGGANRRTGRQREERRRVGERKVDEDREFVHGGRGEKTQHGGRGRERKEQERHSRPTRPSESVTQIHPSAATSSAAEGETESSLSESGSNRLSKYDLNSHKVAIVDEIGTRGGVMDEWSYTTETGGFVEVTSKKTIKEKIRKEKEEMRKEEKRLEEQKKRRKKKPAASTGQVGMDPQASSANKPYTAWSSLDSKSDTDSWNAAPGSQLKSTQLQGSSWGGPALPASGFGIGGGGRGGNGAATADTGDVTGGDASRVAGDSKAAVPHTAELVSSSSASTDNNLYNLFHAMPVLYSHFSPSVTSATSSLLDAAVESTIGTVTSPRTVSGHATLLVEDTPSLPLEGILSAAPCAPEPQDATAGRRLSEGLLPPPHNNPGVSKGLPPYVKSVGRGRGMKTGMGERKDRKRGRFDREHGGRQERTPSNPKVRCF